MSRVPLESTSPVVRREEILGAEVGNELVLMSVEKGVYYGLNSVGARVWTLLREPVRVQDLCEKIVEEFEVSQQQCQKDILELLADLQGQGLIRIAEESPS